MSKKHDESFIRIKKLPKEKYYKIITDLTGQIPIQTSFKYSLYKSTRNLTLTIGFKYQPESNEFFKIFYKCGHYYICHIQIQDLIEYLNINKSANVKFVCLPIYYHNCHISKSHVGTVTFDLINENIFILEPNGLHPLEFVNKLFLMLVKDMNRHNLNYTFIPLQKWLPSKRNINDERGICATCNLFLIDRMIHLANRVVLNEYLSSLTKSSFINQLDLFINEKIDRYIA